jgi:hypothetical protein
VKAAIIFNKACPDIILANNRIAKLNSRAIYEISSIITSAGAIKIGVPSGKNNFKKLFRCNIKPDILMPIKSIHDSSKVKTSELVFV